MARISGVDLPRDKRIEIALTYILGIGTTTAVKIIAETGVDPDVRVKDLTEDDVSKLRDYIERNVKVEGDLRRETQFDIKRLIEIGSYGAFVTAGGCLCAVSAQKPMRGHAKARRRPSPTRRSKSGGFLWQANLKREPLAHAAAANAKISSGAPRTSSRRSTTPS